MISVVLLDVSRFSQMFVEIQFHWCINLVFEMKSVRKTVEVFPMCNASSASDVSVSLFVLDFYLDLRL